MCAACQGVHDGFTQVKEKEVVGMDGAVAHLVMGLVSMAKKEGEVFMLTKNCMVTRGHKSIARDVTLLKYIFAQKL
jgi:hypothetical protein